MRIAEIQVGEVSGRNWTRQSEESLVVSIQVSTSVHYSRLPRDVPPLRIPWTLD